MLWIPLAAMWLIMGIEQPAINAAITRLADARIELAAFGVTFSIGLLVESPIIQLLAAGTALGSSTQRYRRLMRFMHIFAVLLTVIHIVLAIPAVWQWVIGDLNGAPREIIEPARRAFVVMVPWSAAIGYRRLWQGVLIRHKRSDLVSLSMVFRLIVTGGVLIFGVFVPIWPGAVLGGLALSAGVIAGAVAARVLAAKTIASLPAEEAPAEQLGWGKLFRFYTPLALTSFIIIAARPVLNMGLSAAPSPLNSLAVWPVITGFLFLFHSVTFAIQEVTISVADEAGRFKTRLTFALFIGAATSLLLAIVSITPASSLWFRYVNVLDADLLLLAERALPILIPFPFFASLAFAFRGEHIAAGRTTQVTIGAGINVFILVVGIFVVAPRFPFPGVLQAAFIYLTALVGEAIFLGLRTWFSHRTRKRGAVRFAYGRSQG